MYVLKLRISQLSRKSKRFQLKNDQGKIETIPMTKKEMKWFLLSNYLYKCADYIFTENDELIGMIYKKKLARRVRICYSLDKKRIDKRIWNA